jgi:hypothetical protein
MTTSERGDYGYKNVIPGRDRSAKRLLGRFDLGWKVR